MFLKLMAIMMFFPVGEGGAPKTQNNEVAAAVESFRKAVIDANAEVLSKLLDNALSYGHSDGHVEGKNELITKLSDGTYDFKTMELTAQTIIVSGDVAIVRNTLDGKTNDGGKPNEAHLYVLMVWHKAAGSWKLLARQAVKRVVG